MWFAAGLKRAVVGCLRRSAVGQSMLVTGGMVWGEVQVPCPVVWERVSLGIFHRAVESGCVAIEGDR